MDPEYGPVDSTPTVAVWRDADLEFSVECLSHARGPMALVVALAGRFEHVGGLEELAARIGAISATQGMQYWSVTDGAWRPLISKAYAVEDPTTLHPRPDFTALEILGGTTLYLTQNDTRSTGLNIYSLTARMSGPDRLVVEIVNLTPIRFMHAPLFARKALISAHFVQRLQGNVWGYYSLSAVRAGSFGGREKSLINRAAAYYRFLIGVPGDKHPPLAP